MTVRAKFKVSTITRMQGSRKKAGTQNEYEACEMQSIKLNPVYGGGDANHENAKFWEATPSGEITMNTINGAAGSYFELGDEYYVDFTKAPT